MELSRSTGFENTRRFDSWRRFTPDMLLLLSIIALSLRSQSPNYRLVSFTDFEADPCKYVGQTIAVAGHFANTASGGGAKKLSSVGFAGAIFEINSNPSLETELYEGQAPPDESVSGASSVRVIRRDVKFLQSTSGQIPPDVYRGIIYGINQTLIRDPLIPPNVKQEVIGVVEPMAPSMRSKAPCGIVQKKIRTMR